jgi:hypothetical protein
MALSTSVLIPVVLAANVQTDITGGGLSSDDAGAFDLNICNNNSNDVTLSGIFITDGVDPEERHRVHPSCTIKAKGYGLIEKIKLHAGWKVFIEANATISVQLIGDRRG